MPRRIVGAAFLSLDGVMQAPGGPTEDPTGGFAHGGWLAKNSDEAIEQEIGKLFAGPFDLLLGRRTYDIFAAYWPYQPTDNPIAAAFATCAKYVLTHSDAPLEWTGSHRLADLDALAALKRRDGLDLVIQGSSTLYPPLLERGLIDRLVTMVAPVTLGTGKRLFGQGTPARVYKPVGQRIGSAGCVISVFEPGGEVETGSFGGDNPSEAEHARQRKIAAGTW